MSTTLGVGLPLCGGAVDIVLALRRLEGSGPSNRRVIQALSRFDETPEKLVVELTSDGYISRGNEPAVAHVAAKAGLLERLADVGNAGLAMDELVTRLSHPRTTIQGALEELVTEHQVVRTGGGVRGDPYRFAIVNAFDRPDGVSHRPTGYLQDSKGVEQLAELLRNVGPHIHSFGELS